MSIIKIKKTAIILITLLLTANFSKAQEPTCDIEIEVIGIKNIDGQIMISINRGPEGWP